MLQERNSLSHNKKERVINLVKEKKTIPKRVVVEHDEGCSTYILLVEWEKR